VKEKVIAVVLDAVALGGDGAVTDEHVTESALEIAPSPLAWQRTRDLVAYTQDR